MPLPSDKQQPHQPFKTQPSSLGLSAFHERRRVLEEEHEWLLKQIQRKRKELKKFLDEMRSVATEMFAQSSPFYQELMNLDAEIHRLFEQIFSNKKLGKKSKGDITALYHSLQFMGVISPNLKQEEDEDEELDEMFENSADEEFDFREHFSDDYSDKNYHHSQQTDSSESAFKSPQSKEIRQTFLKLASLFHPDKVTDTETKMRHDEIMKELNRAYQEGDIARLLEIEKQHHLDEEIDFNNSSKSEIEKQCQRREKDNQLLRNQYENLKSELRLARNTPEGEMVKDYRACKREGIDFIKEMLSQIENQVRGIENIRNFVKDFVDKKITLNQFLKGPTPRRKSTPKDEEDIMAMLLEKMLEMEF